MMRILPITLCILMAAGCTRPSSSLSFADLTRAASAGLNEYYEWVEKDEADAETVFPNALCLAGILFEVKLSDTQTKSAGASLPLAGPSAGLTSLFGYSLSVTEENVGVFTVPMYAKYQNEPRTDEELIDAEFEAFLEQIPTLKKQFARETLEGGGVRTPPGMDATTFNSRNDLAAELWTLRQAIHGMVLNSPKDVVLTPGELPIIHEYRVTAEQEGSAKISLVGKGAASFGAGRRTTDHNRMGIFFKANQSDKMLCDSASVPKEVARALKLP